MQRCRYIAEINNSLFLESQGPRLCFDLFQTASLDEWDNQFQLFEANARVRAQTCDWRVNYEMDPSVTKSTQSRALWNPIIITLFTSSIDF